MEQVGLYYFFRQLRENRSIPAQRIPRLLTMAGRILLSQPFRWYENLFYRRHIERTPIRRSPVFIIGHFRSGTTFLHKLLTRTNQWAYADLMDFFFPCSSAQLKRLLQPPMQWLANRFRLTNVTFNDYALLLDDPSEEEMCLSMMGCYHSSYWGFVYPRRGKALLGRFITIEGLEDRETWKKNYLYFLKRLSWQKGSKPLLLKNPPNTGRIAHILELFPEAQFIFIYRNPYEVFYSTRRLWQKTIIPYFSLQEIPDEQIKSRIFWYFDLLTGAYFRDRRLIPRGNLVEVRYEELLTSPLETLKKLYESLGWTFFDEDLPILQNSLEKEKEHKKSTYHFTEQQCALVEKHWGTFIQQWGYSRPV